MRSIQGNIQTLSVDTPPPRRASLPRLGRYQLITRLAVGGMAEVHLARHGELAGFRTLVVVKKVLPHLASNPDFITMFLDEARIASLLDHPNVVRIVEVGCHGEEFFLAMELVQGKPLSSLLRRALLQKTTLDPKMAAWIVAQAAAGLHYAHGVCGSDGQSLGVVHRDVSPQNILISFEGAVKVIDFGIAGALGRLTDTGGGGLKGKIGYMAPEQARAEPIDHRVDTFALGVVLWESLCCRRLFARRTDFATMRAVLEDPIPLPSTVVPVPAALEEIVMKALSRDPAARFGTAAEMSQALERVAFLQGGVSTGDLAGLMKEYFSEDRTQWATTTRLALEMADPSDSTQVRGIKLTQTGLPITGGLLADPPSGARPLPAARPLSPRARHWRFLALGLAAVALIAIVLAWPRSSPVARTPARDTIEIPHRPAPAPPPAEPAPPPAVLIDNHRNDQKHRPRRAQPPRTTSAPATLPERRPNPFE